MFNLAQVIGNGTVQTLFTNSTLNEAVISGWVFNNAAGSEQTLTVTVGTTSFDLQVPVGNTTSDFKVSVPADTAAQINPVTSVSVAAHYVEQAIDPTAALNQVQTIISTLPEGSLNDTITSGVNTWSSQKISDELDLKTSIDDLTVTTTTTWSSQKINSELASKVGSAEADAKYLDLAQSQAVALYF